jgi:hypothetical protein
VHHLHVGKNRKFPRLSERKTAGRFYIVKKKKKGLEQSHDSEEQRGMAAYGASERRRSSAGKVCTCVVVDFPGKKNNWFFITCDAYTSSRARTCFAGEGAHICKARSARCLTAMSSNHGAVKVVGTSSKDVDVRIIRASPTDDTYSVSVFFMSNFDL